MVQLLVTKQWYQRRVRGDCLSVDGRMFENPELLAKEETLRTAVHKKFTEYQPACKLDDSDTTRTKYKELSQAHKLPDPQRRRTHEFFSCEDGSSLFRVLASFRVEVFLVSPRGIL
eukprot:TRINITY_DN3862_c0_g1_i2.p1 TRINITY_DN3862_c0_g1~~TRINITY_DN3862_c0_g1_i2.p1  ORF type:complete len:116 (+),score=19.62 TRINITY_DN3862_c0_g1_i2:3-350(+)